LKEKAKKTSIASIVLAFVFCVPFIQSGRAFSLAAEAQKESAATDGREETSASLRSLNLDKPVTASISSLFSDPEAAYIESLVETLQNPIGAVGFESGFPSGQHVDVIIEFDSLPALLQEKFNHSRSGGSIPSDSALAAFKDAARAISSSIEYGYEYTQVLSGVSATVNASDIEALANLPGVYSITPVQPVKSDEGEIVPESSENHSVLDISEIHESGITGKGVKVGILDTGIDYRHPDLQNAYKGGYDYVDGDDDPYEASYEEWEKSNLPEYDGSGNAFYTSHGTHLAGILAAGGGMGLAPGIEIYVQRVLGSYGAGSSDAVIAAIDDALVPGFDNEIMDIINISLGTNLNTAFSPEITALNNAVIAGLTVCVSAGNFALAFGGGSRADESVGAPGTAYLPITVAAARAGGKADAFFHQASVTSAGALEAEKPLAIELRLEAWDSLNNASNPLSGANLEFSEDLGYEALVLTANPLASDLPDGALAGKILALQRGGMTFELMLREAKRLSAGALIVANSEESFIDNMSIAGERKDGMPIFSMRESDGLKLIKAAGGGAAFIMPGEISIEPQPNIPADFSSIGPVKDTVGIKPDIMAPGYQIASTLPAFAISPNHDSDDYSSAYGRRSGTSMAAPHLAGIAALMKERYPKATPAEIKARLMNTANPGLILPDPILSGGTQLSVFEAGAGFVDPKRALLEDCNVFVTVQDDIPGPTLFSPIESQTLSSLSFGAVAKGSGGASSRKIEVTIHNSGQIAITAAIGSFYTSDSRYCLDSEQNGVFLETSEEKAIIEAGSSTTFEARMLFSEWAMLGRYEGRLEINCNESALILPFAALLAEEGKTFEIIDSGIIKPIITSENPGENGAGSNYSMSSSFAVSWSGIWPSDEMFLVLLDDAGYAIGLFDAYYVGMASASSSAITEEIFSGLISEYYPLNESGWIDYSNYISIPDGIYSLAATYGTSYHSVGRFVASNSKPVLTWDFNGFEVSYEEGMEYVTLKGNIYSDGAQKLKDNGIENWRYKKVIGQEANILHLGENAYLSDIRSDNSSDWLCNEFGDFEIELDASSLEKPVSLLSAQALDYYVETVLRDGTITATGNMFSNKQVLCVKELRETGKSDDEPSDSDADYGESSDIPYDSASSSESSSDSASSKESARDSASVQESASDSENSSAKESSAGSSSGSGSETGGIGFSPGISENASIIPEFDAFVAELSMLQATPVMQGPLNFPKKNIYLDIYGIRDAGQMLADELYLIGLVAGVGKDEEGNPAYELDRPLARIEAVSLILRLMGVEDEASRYTGPNPFQDVPEWADRYAAYAHEIGLAAGINDEHTILEATREIDFKEFTAMLLRALGYTEAKGSFDFNSALEKSVELDLYTGYEMNAMKVSAAFLRSEAFIASTDALTFYQPEDNRLFIYSLVEKGAISMDEANTFVYNASIMHAR
jgi:subtilisin family serine protease